MNADNWQIRRRQFNHDWLRNRYIVALNSWLQLIDGAIDDAQLARDYVQHMLPQWETHRLEVDGLMKDFQLAMSPRQLFSIAPLSRCDEETKRWLGQLVHDIWVERIEVKALEKRVEREAASADAAYAELTKRLDERGPASTLDAMQSLRHLFQRFRDACLELGDALSELPHEIKVV